LIFVGGTPTPVVAPPEIALDDDGYPVGKLDHVAADAEQEASESAISYINRVLTVAPPHVEELKPLLIRCRHLLSERNDKLATLFGDL